MSDLVFLLVLLAAFLHASWNGLVKSSDNKLASITAVMLGHLPLCLLAIYYLPFPPLESWYWLISSVFFHIGYQLFLVLSYRLGDYTQVYPLARGSAPVWVTLASLYIFGVDLSFTSLLGICLICFGLLTLAFLRSNGFRNPRAVVSALCTGFFIACYSLLDGYGARSSGDAVSYVAWMMTLNAFLFLVLTSIYDKSTLRIVFTHERYSFWLGGTISTIAYMIVVWGMLHVPIPLVTTLRETSTLFALLIGFLFLGERPTYVKFLAIVISLFGIFLLYL